MTRSFSLAYDMEGREIVIDAAGNYVTHIPCHLSNDEVLEALERGENINFDARNQGMQNIPEAQVDENIPVEVAPQEMWPLFYAWRMNWLANWDYHDTRTFEEFTRDFNAAGLSLEQEMQIISDWKAFLSSNPHVKATFEQFREGYIRSMPQAQVTAADLQDTPHGR